MKGAKFGRVLVAIFQQDPVAIVSYMTKGDIGLGCLKCSGSDGEEPLLNEEQLIVINVWRRTREGRHAFR